MPAALLFLFSGEALREAPGETFASFFKKEALALHFLIQSALLPGRSVLSSKNVSYIHFCIYATHVDGVTIQSGARRR
jgi:hypothetical protein